MFICFFGKRSKAIRFTGVFTLIIFLFRTLVFGGTSPKTIVATRTANSPRIDGVIDPIEWKAAVPASGFTQFDPEEGAPATEATSVFVLYDDDALYVGVKCADSDPKEIVHQLTRRDRSTQADRISVIIDSYHDENTAFLFSGSVSGVQSDGVLSQDGTIYDVQWDAVWEFGASVNAEGWGAEFRIPYSALRFTGNEAEYVWGINFRRYIARKKETDEWVMVGRDEAPVGTISSVSKMGHLSGLRDIHPPLHLEILPYQMSCLKYLSQPDPFPLRRDLRSTIGLDLKYGITQNFTLDIAANPDFGQVEVDQSVLNLTVFETFYPEKRPFFLEGSPIFSFGNSFDGRQLRLFYTRRIGKQPIAPYPPDSGFSYVDEPQVTTILGAGKLTGKTGGGLSVGLLTALTGEEQGVAEDIAGNRKPPVIFEPEANYNVLRLKQDVGDRGAVGMIATTTFKDRRFPSLAGGVDWNLRPGGGKIAIDGYLSGSQLTPEEGTRNTGSSGRIGIGTLESENWFGFGAYDFATHRFSINDAGYFSQPRDQGGYAELSYRENYAEEPIRRYSFTTNYSSRWNWNGTRTLQQVEFEPKWELRNFWLLTLDFVHEMSAHDDEYRGIVGLYRRPESNTFAATIQSDSRKAIHAVGHGGFESAGNGMTSWWTSFQWTLRPNSWMEFSPALTVVVTRSEEAWPLFFYTAGGKNLFGDRDIDQYDISLRGTITFSRSISLQFFTQVLLAKGQYSNFRELEGPDRLTSIPYDKSAGNPDFNEKILNANIVFRWEYLPASTVYLVWTQARFGDDAMYGRSVGESLGETFKLPMDNVLLAKVTYWWSL